MISPLSTIQQGKIVNLTKSSIMLTYSKINKYDTFFTLIIQSNEQPYIKTSLKYPQYEVGLAAFNSIKSKQSFLDFVNYILNTRPYKPDFAPLMRISVMERRGVSSKEEPAAPEEAPIDLGSESDNSGIGDDGMGDNTSPNDVPPTNNTEEPQSSGQKETTPSTPNVEKPVDKSEPKTQEKPEESDDDISDLIGGGL